MRVPSVSKNRRSVSTMPNKYGVLAISCLLAVFICMTSQAEEQIPVNQEMADILDRLISPDELRRFGDLEKAKENINRIKADDIERLVTSLRQKNMSTLIFVLMETGSDILYHLSPPAQMSVENSAGSFPNIAYYYARINPEKGLGELYRLYDKNRDQRLHICKAIGEVGSLKAAEFLMAEAMMAKESGNSIVPMLAGLLIYNKPVGQDKILWLLEQSLDREEIILLSELNIGFSQNELAGLYNYGGKKADYAVQYIFRDPVANFEAIRFIVDKELENKNYDRVLEWMMSDIFERINDPQLKLYRESLLELIRKKMNIR